jgi:hypothetical protein
VQDDRSADRGDVQDPRQRRLPQGFNFIILKKVSISSFWQKSFHFVV